MNETSSFTDPRGYRDAPPRNESAHALARALGWFSIGLGVAELLRPRDVSRAAGIHRADRLLRGYGAREVITGAALLASARPEPFVWARVAGDVLDVATLGAAAKPRSGQRTAIAALALLGVTLVDALCAAALRRETRQRQARPPAHYGQRSGFPRGVQQMRGAAVAGTPTTLQEPGEFLAQVRPVPVAANAASAQGSS
jgi:hypothetical protein